MGNATNIDSDNNRIQASITNSSAVLVLPAVYMHGALLVSRAGAFSLSVAGVALGDKKCVV
jgi:hypothetical protein